MADARQLSVYISYIIVLQFYRSYSITYFNQKDIQSRCINRYKKKFQKVSKTDLHFFSFNQVIFLGYFFGKSPKKRNDSKFCNDLYVSAVSPVNQRYFIKYKSS